MATATPEFDPGNGWVPRYSENQRGVYVRQPYRVDTSEPQIALTAGGLPAKGSPHPFFPQTYVVSLEPEFVCGKDGGGGDPNAKGTTIVWVTYEPIDVQSFDLLYEPGDSYSELRSNDGQIAIRYDVSGSPVPETQREAMQSEIVVYRYSNTNAPWISFLPYVDTVNSSPVAIPSVYGVGGPVVQAARTLKARAPEITLARPGVMRIGFRFAIGIQDWMLYRYRAEDANGNPTGPVFEKEIYPVTAWPVVDWWGA